MARSLPPVCYRRRGRVAGIAGALERVREGVLRCCPICDAFEVIGRDLAVVGPGACAAGEALYLRAYSRRITLVTLGGPSQIAEEALAQVRAAGVTIVEDEVSTISGTVAGCRCTWQIRAPLRRSLRRARGPAPHRARCFAGRRGRWHWTDHDGRQPALLGRWLLCCRGRGDRAQSDRGGDGSGQIAAVDIHNHLRETEGLCLAPVA